MDARAPQHLSAARPSGRGGTPVESDLTPHVLARVGLFEDLSREEIEQLASLVRRRRYRKGATIFYEGDPGECLYILESGSVRIGLTSEQGKELALALLGPGDFFGDLALLDGEPHSADAVAKEDCSLLLLHRQDFQAYLDTRPRVASQLLAVLSRRIRRNTQMLQEAAFLDVPGRVASALLQLADTQGQPAPDAPGGQAVVIPSPPTQSELAAIVGATRESVNKWLRYYERIGLIRSEPRALHILRPHQLRSRVS